MPTRSQNQEGRNANSNKNLPRQQKTAVIFLAFFAILIIVLWAFQLNAQLNRPFSIAKNASPSSTATTTDASLKDSDGDGLTDYDEINIYHTSAYLEDSDSDGLSDKQEVDGGTDPNCPTGQNCVSSETANTNSNSAASTTMESLGAETPSATSTAASLLGPNGEITPAFLRDILRQNGYDQATLDQITDEQLLQSYQDAMTSQAAGTSAQ
ncbi:MAG: thrombospondin type 3 repeat-containing protein [Patescibacteria group bacterium]